MDKTTITLTIDSERMRAMEVFLRKDGSSVQARMDEALRALFDQVVPAPVREYLDGIGGSKPKRTSSASRPKTPPKQKTNEEIGNEQP
jgi:hypothetical protein